MYVIALTDRPNAVIILTVRKDGDTSTPGVKEVNVRLTHLSDSLSLVDLGRVEILFYLGAPVAVMDWCGKALHAADAPEGTEVAKWVDRMEDGGKYTRTVASRDSIEAFIVLAYKDPYPNGRSPRTHSPKGRE